MWRDINLKKPNELKVRNKYWIKISRRSAALENLNDSEGMNRAWENIKETIKISAKESLGLYELKQYKTMASRRMFTIFRSKEAG